MKTVFVLRHGKAEGHSAGGDFARKLTDRGEVDAAKAGKHIAGIILSPSWIVTSDAARAMSTARIVAKVMGVEEVDVDHDIYEASVNDLVQVVHRMPEAEQTAVIVGHNPGLEGLIYFLADDPSKIVGLGTACVAQLELAVDRWGDVHSGCGRVVSTYSP